VDFIYFLKLIRLYNLLKPDFIIHYTIKPNIYGSMASNLLGIKSIAVITGLGYTFIQNNFLAKFIRKLYKVAFDGVQKVFVLNSDDRDLLIEFDVASNDKVLILPSEGINTEYFKSNPNLIKSNPNFRFIYIGRLLHDKGVGLVAEVAKRFQTQNIKAEFVLLGFIDEDNPSGVSKEELEIWQEDGYIKYLGSKDDVRSELQNSDCLLFASTYKEGVPRILLEAGALQIPIITTDNVGCRDVVRDKINGILCDATSQDLYDKCKDMMRLSQEEREEFGTNSREYIIENFSSLKVNKIYLENIK
jgi:glycosyltransferase involved in cell wall biosynthesis